MKESATRWGSWWMCDAGMWLCIKGWGRRAGIRVAKTKGVEHPPSSPSTKCDCFVRRLLGKFWTLVAKGR